jgi:hypothetical protein
MRPSLDNSMLRRYASGDPHSSKASTACFQGNSTLESSAWDRGPGTRSPGTVQTLDDSTLSVPYVYTSSKFIEHRGSTHPILVIEGLTALRYVPIPVRVPAVPMPAQTTLIWGNWANICGPVHFICAPQFCKAASQWCLI